MMSRNWTIDPGQPWVMISGRAFGSGARAAGAIRPDLEVDDLSLLLEQLAAVRVVDEGRTRQLRRRYLALLLEALHAPAESPLPGPPPTGEEISQRWEM